MKQKKKRKVKSPGLHEIRKEIGTVPVLSTDSPQLTFVGIKHGIQLTHKNYYYCIYTDLNLNSFYRIFLNFLHF